MIRLGKRKLSIGMPIYNAEKFLQNRLDSLLSQPFSDFELIISDDASTDSTPNICKEYALRDKRIRYIRQEKNIGISSNFYFVLHEASNDYFFWAAQDDVTIPGFIEKNIHALDNNTKLICSVSKIKFVGEIIDNLSTIDNDSQFNRIMKKIKRRIVNTNTQSISGNYEYKVRKFLMNKGSSLAQYGIFRTNILKKSVEIPGFHGDESAIVLSALKYGDINVIDEFLIHKHVGDTVSSSGMINLIMKFKPNFLGKIIPYYDITKWCLHNLGIKLFIKNLDYFLKLNLIGYMYLSYDIVRRISVIIKK
jgi:glycosyltransferase involved in cell wall biosynthesis